MKKKIKMITLLFVLAIVSTLSIYAATIFNSNDVSYNNDSSGMKSTNVQDAIDELYLASSSDCALGYSKGTTTASSYICNKESEVATGTINYDSSYVAYDNSNGMTATTVQGAIDELAGILSTRYCITNYEKENETDSSYTCKLLSYVVTFNANGGTGTMNDLTCYTNTECSLTASTFERTGYTFDGWSIEQDGSKVYDDEEGVNNIANGGETIELFAKWVIHSNTLTVSPNGGTVAFDGANITTSTSKTQDYNTTIDYGNPTRGNSTASAGSYKVSYSANGGNSTPSAQSATRTTTTSYTFSNWTTSGTCGALSSTTNSGTYTFPANSGTTCTMTANWSSSSSTTTAAVKLASAIGRGGYNFAGWKSSTNNVTYSAGTNYTPTANTTMTAQWTPVNYTITYNLNSGSISGQKTSYNIETASFTLPTPTRGGYTFTGWTGTGLSSATKTVTVAKGSTGNRSYTANWEENTYYAFGTPTTSSTTNYTTLGKKVFISLKGTQKSVCIIYNNKLECFKYNNATYEKNHILQLFGSSNCNVNPSWSVKCSNSEFVCDHNNNGNVFCKATGSKEIFCAVESGNASRCG